MHIRRSATATTLAAAAAMLAGCTTVMDGAATRDPGFIPGQVITALLQTGNYPRAPLPPLAPNALRAIQFEAQRMAGYVIYPWEVDPGFTALDEMGTTPITTLAGLSAQIPGATVRDIGAANGFINGFTTSRGTPDSAPGRHMALNLMVLRFPDPDKATAAATAFAAQNQGTDGSTNIRPITIPGHPEAPAVAATLFNGRPSVSTFSAHGLYVFYAFSQTDDTAEASAAAIGKALDLQGPRIDQFQPTDPAQFATMNPDPTGQFVRALPRNKGEGKVLDGIWDSKAMLHLFVGDNPTAATDRFTTYGIDEVIMNQTTVYRAKDPAAANGFSDTVAKDFANGANPDPVVPGFPAAKCFNIQKPQDFGDRFQCVATADRYVITVFTKRSQDAIQQTSAQYLMLTEKQ